jgi:transcriptional regulator with XRE-family HTH domain
MNYKNTKYDIGDRIKLARTNLKKSSIQISKELHLSHSICSQWERGISSPSTKHLVKLADILKVSFEWLAIGEESNNKNVELDDFTTENTKLLEIHNLLDKTTHMQKSYLLKLLKDIIK